MTDITKIWKEFNEDQDKKELFAKAELEDKSKEYKEKAQEATATKMYGSHKYLHMSYELAVSLIRDKHGVVERTLENAFTWYNNKHENN